MCSACRATGHLLDAYDGILHQQGYPDEEVALGIGLLERMMRCAMDRPGYDSLVAYAGRVSDRRWYRQFVRDQVPAADARFWNTYRAMLDVDPRPTTGALAPHIPVLVVLGEAR